MARALCNMLVNRIHDRELKRALGEHARGRMIDIGCGAKPYKEMAAPYVEEHVGVDHEATLHDKSRIDLFGTAYEIPAGDLVFDTAMCTAVLEHLEEPQAAVSECYRVLKPGGKAIYTAPFIWHVHEAPRDFFRYSRYGLEHLFKKAGFEIVEIKALSGFWVTFGVLLTYNVDRLNRGPLRWLGIVPALEVLIQWAAAGLNRLDRTEQWTWMYLVVARRPEGVKG